MKMKDEGKNTLFGARTKQKDYGRKLESPELKGVGSMIVDDLIDEDAAKCREQSKYKETLRVEDVVSETWA